MLLSYCPTHKGPCKCSAAVTSNTCAHSARTTVHETKHTCHCFSCKIYCSIPCPLQPPLATERLVSGIKTICSHGFYCDNIEKIKTAYQQYSIFIFCMSWKHKRVTKHKNNFQTHEQFSITSMSRVASDLRKCCQHNITITFKHYFSFQIKDIITDNTLF